MPTYEYVCTECGYEFEKFQSMKEDHLKTCPSCKKNALKRKIGTGAGFIFKGGGFYCNDYKGANASLPPTTHHQHSATCGCGGEHSDHPCCPADKPCPCKK